MRIVCQQTILVCQQTILMKYHALFVIMTLMRHHCGVVCRPGIRCSLLVQLIRDLAQNNMIPKNKTFALSFARLYYEN